MTPRNHLIFFVNLFGNGGQNNNEHDDITYSETMDRITNKKIMNWQVKMNYHKIVFERTKKKTIGEGNKRR